MTVKELKALLDKCDENLEVKVFNPNDELCYHISAVGEYEDPDTPFGCYISLEV